MTSVRCFFPCAKFSTSNFWGNSTLIKERSNVLHVTFKCRSKIIVRNASRKSSKKALKKQRAVKEFPSSFVEVNRHLLIKIVKEISFVECGKPLNDFLENHEQDIRSFNFRLLIETLIQSKFALRALQVAQWAYAHSFHFFDIKSINRFISLSGKAKDLDAAKGFFLFIKKNDIQPTVYSHNALMNAFAQCYKFEEAVKVFQTLLSEEVGCSPDAFSFSSAISHYFKLEDYESVNRLFQEMKSRRFQADVITYTETILSAFSNAQSDDVVSDVEELMDCMKSDGLTADIILFNSIINALSKKGKVKEMEKFYDMMIACHCKPSSHTFHSMIVAYTQTNDIRMIEKIMVDVMKTKEGLSPHVLSALVQAYAKQKMYEKAESILTQYSPSPNLSPPPPPPPSSPSPLSPSSPAFRLPPDHYYTRAYNALIDAYGKDDKPDQALSLFAKMKKNKVCKMNSWTYAVITQALVKTKRMEEALAMVEEMEKANLASHACYHVLMEGYGRSLQPQKAEKLIERMKEKDVWPTTWTWNVLMQAYLHVDAMMEMKRVWMMMMESDCVANEVTCLMLVQMHAKNGELWLAERDLEEIRIRLGWGSMMNAYNALLYAYGQEKRWEEAECLFVRMQTLGCRPDISTYNTMLSIYGKSGMLLKMENLFRDMEKRGTEANQISYLSLVNAFASHKCFERSEDIIKSLKRKGQVPCKNIYNAMIAAYSKAGMHDNAEKCIVDMEGLGMKADEFTFCSRIGGYLMQYRVKEAEELMTCMHEEGLNPPPFIRKWLDDAKISREERGGERISKDAILTREGGGIGFERRKGKRLGGEGRSLELRQDIEKYMDRKWKGRELKEEKSDFFELKESTVSSRRRKVLIESGWVSVPGRNYRNLETMAVKDDIDG